MFNIALPNPWFKTCKKYEDYVEHLDGSKEHVASLQPVEVELNITVENFQYIQTYMPSCIFFKNIWSSVWSLDEVEKSQIFITHYHDELYLWISESPLQSQLKQKHPYRKQIPHRYC